MYKARMKVVVANKELELLTIGEVSKTLGKSVETLRAWEREKITPKPLFKTGKVRLYHPDEVKTMKKVLRKIGKRARKTVVQKEMWAAIVPVQKEIKDFLDGKTSQN